MGGGQATNSGIDYQQRIAAFFMINLFASFDISSYFNHLKNNTVIKKIYYEADTPIDDLVLESVDGKKIYLQIKRSIDLSVRENSDFRNVMVQFISEFLRRSNTVSSYGLITTSNSSSKVIYDLKKLFISIGLNGMSFEQNPLNESEKSTLDKVRSLFANIYKEKTDRNPDDEEFIKFAKKCFISSIDIEEGHTIEISAKLLLRSLGFKAPNLIWSVLIKNGLYYSANRLSIEKESLEEVLGSYLESDTREKVIIKDKIFSDTEFNFKGQIPSGKEVLLIESFLDDADYLIVELFRFKDDCKPKSVFYGNKVRVSKEEWTVIQRFATVSGLERYMEENQDQYKDKRIGMFPANEIDFVEDSDCAKLHRSKMLDLLNKNTDQLICLHCGKSINTRKALNIEIDDRDSLSSVGIVHSECLRPIDRILGIPYFEGEEPVDYLQNFNYKKWIKLRINGQGMMNEIKTSTNLLQGKIPVIAWSSTDEYDVDYSYCIRFVLEDNTFTYDLDRGKLARYNKIEAEETLDFYLKTLEKFKIERNPKCFTSIKKRSGRYSDLLKIKDADEEILEVIDVEIVKYSKSIAKLIENNIFYYAPMCLLRDRESEMWVTIANIVPIISDPVYFENILKNWEKTGITLSPFELKIIKSDKDFDNVMRMIFRDGLTPIIDPEFDMRKKLAKGFPVQEYNEIISRGRSDRVE